MNECTRLQTLPFVKETVAFSSGQCAKFTSENISLTLALLGTGWQGARPCEETVHDLVCSTGEKQPFQWAETFIQMRKAF